MFSFKKNLDHLWEDKAAYSFVFLAVVGYDEQNAAKPVAKRYAVIKKKHFIF